ncbi:MAG: PSD1 and planctomycete cytochrome C domain-containing protein, partial [Planctomycetota bacterium]
MLLRTLLAFLLCVATLTSRPPSACAQVSYEHNIRPLLKEKCSSCHGAIRQEAGLRLDHGELLRNGGDSGKVVDEEAVDQSKILIRVRSEDDSLLMPPPGEGERLNEEQVRLLRDWISAGATSPQDEAVPTGPDEHWAWLLPKQAPIPADVPAEWRRNPIDAFVFDILRSRNLTPNAVADWNLRLRGLSFDLTGLPPDPQLLQSPQSREDDWNESEWEEIVELYLASPAYGERWARHWMDVWRYSDWDGYKQELRGSQRHIWRWRDWIVQSLVEDIGYDQMILEMLAADELSPEDESALRATGYLARNFHKSNRDIWLDAAVEHTAKAFLATTLNCARCHDHKYDPIGQDKYYRFRAIFEPHQVRIDRLPGQKDTKKEGLVRAFDAEPDAQTFLYVGGNEKLPDKVHPLEPGVFTLFDAPYSPTPVSLPAESFYPSLQPHVYAEDLKEIEDAIGEARKKLTTTTDAANEAAEPSDIVQLREQVDQDSLSYQFARKQALIATFEADQLRYASTKADAEQFIQDRESAYQDANEAQHESAIAQSRLAASQSALAVAEATAALNQVEKEQKESTNTDASGSPAPAQDKAKKPEAPNITTLRKDLESARKKRDQDEKALADLQKSSADIYAAMGQVYPQQSTGRRLALARWITDARNPLAARVAVNYVWMHLLGKPLVDNTFDFGMQTEQPVHHQLLDYLAVELMENEWSLKHVVRLIVLSRTYQLSSTRMATEDPSMHEELVECCGRAIVRRLDAEAIRDSVLAVGDSLDRRFGGPEIPFAQGQSTPRRSLYFQHAYEKQMTMLVVFDAASPTECYRRSPSVIPQQALALANSPIALRQSRKIARQIWVTDPVESSAADTSVTKNHIPTNETAEIEKLFWHLLGRPALPDEISACEDFLVEQERLFRSSNDLKSGRVDASEKHTKEARSAP